MLICGIDLAEGKKDSTDTPLLYKKIPGMRFTKC